MISADRLKMIWGFLVIVIIAALAVLIAFKNVEQQSSYGLEPILVALTAGLASFCNWAFAGREKAPPTDELQKKL